MDLARFRLTRRPFRPTPDSDAYFAAEGHEAAGTALRRALSDREGIALLDGDPGTGKTIAALKLLEGLPADLPRVMVPAPRFARPADLFQAILFDLGAEYRGLTEHELRLAVTDRLLGALAAGGPTVIVFDEAQHLTAEMLEEVRLLGNLETRSAKAALVVLVALPALRESLAKAPAAAQRIAVRCRLEPLGRDESVRFVWHQLEAAGGRPDDLISEEAVHLLADHCRGVPRLLNQAAGFAFTLAGEGGEDRVDVEPAIEALLRLGLMADEPATVEVEVPAKPVGRRKKAA